MDTKRLAAIVSESTRDMIIEDIVGATYPNLRRSQDAIGALKDLTPETEFVSTEKAGVYEIHEVGQAAVGEDIDASEIPESEAAPQTLTLSGKSETKSQSVKK